MLFRQRRLHGLQPAPRRGMPHCDSASITPTLLRGWAVTPMLVSRFSLCPKRERGHLAQELSLVKSAFCCVRRRLHVLTQSTSFTRGHVEKLSVCSLPHKQNETIKPSPKIQLSCKRIFRNLTRGTFSCRKT